LKLFQFCNISCKSELRPMRLRKQNHCEIEQPRLALYEKEAELSEALGNS
jgi:hypothetical protein